jgi:hypothetical protein
MLLLLQLEVRGRWDLALPCENDAFEYRCVILDGERAVFLASRTQEQ